MIHLQLYTVEPRAVGSGTPWVVVATLHADGSSYDIDDRVGLVDLSLRVPSPRYPEPIAFEDDPEEWIRALSVVYNAPDLVATVLRDTSPWEIPDLPRSETPTIPEGHSRGEQPADAVASQLTAA